MIILITEIIKRHPEWLRSQEAKLSFAKMSTPTSGGGLDSGQGKVLLFVFEQGQVIPTLCVKTVRTYSEREIIESNYGKLKLLHEGVEGSDYGQIFSKPLYFHDDGEFVFSIETVCPGRAFSTEELGIDIVIEKYGAWQGYLSRQSKGVWDQTSLKGLVRTLVEKLDLSPGVASDLIAYYDKVSLPPDFSLPMIIQHGDVTPNNVIISGQDVYFIDYDFVGLSYLPGFDLFNFLLKLKHGQETFCFHYKKYFSSYFEAISASVEQYEGLFFIYYLYELGRKWGRKERQEGRDILTEFSRFIEKC